MDFINHPLFVKLQIGHHITLIWHFFFKKGYIGDDVLYDDDDGHKDNDHDNPIDYKENDNFVINIIITTNNDDDVDGVVYDKKNIKKIKQNNKYKIIHINNK